MGKKLKPGRKDRKQVERIIKEKLFNHLVKQGVNKAWLDSHVEVCY
jgi:hypothetical protein